jgi:16S rRNA (cytidine1402-2'-O)-methyltransferase
MLTLVPVPIGNPGDFTLRGIEVLKAAEIIIVEERKESSAWLRTQGITGKPFETLNEHSTPEDLKALADLCAEKNVALITDCGTPGFCDPGADLVRKCRERQIKVLALPGASSLMLLLSLSSERLEQFFFRGFLPANSEERELAWKKLAQVKEALVLMDTPYRMNKMIAELAQHFPSRKILMATGLTQESELIVEALGKDLPSKIPAGKAEFMVLVYQQ